MKEISSVEAFRILKEWKEGKSLVLVADVRMYRDDEEDGEPYDTAGGSPAQITSVSFSSGSITTSSGRTLDLLGAVFKVIEPGDDFLEGDFPWQFVRSLHVDLPEDRGVVILAEIKRAT